MKKLIAVLVLLLAGASARADVREDAKRRFSAGEAHYRAGSYEAAITEFQAANKLVPSPILTFNIGLCLEKLGREEQAVKQFREYLQQRPDAPNRAQVEARIVRLEQQLASKPQRTPELYEELEDGPSTAGTEGEPGVTPPPGGAPPADGDDPFARRLPDRRPLALGDAVAGGGVASGPPGDAEQAPPMPGAPDEHDADDEGDERPIYKEWWFWVVVGASALILIDIASTKDDRENRSGVIGDIDTTGVGNVAGWRF